MIILDVVFSFFFFTFFNNLFCLFLYVGMYYLRACQVEVHKRMGKSVKRWYGTSSLPLHVTSMNPGAVYSSIGDIVS